MHTFLGTTTGSVGMEEPVNVKKEKEKNEILVSKNK